MARQDNGELSLDPSAIRHIREGLEFLRIRGHGGVDTLPVRHSKVRVEEVRLSYAGPGAVLGDKVVALDVAGLEVAAVEADRHHAAAWELQAAETLEIGDFHGHGAAVCIRVTP
ncbi:uncharacterized protein PG986_006028 [Apiospora aurea]|uniref:Uncharacterized protein n=1 Tax=Apiospora aurea TaxID=335848 RepID=A0ABR1QJ99_9PEZI